MVHEQYVLFKLSHSGHDLEALDFLPLESTFSMTSKLGISSAVSNRRVDCDAAVDINSTYLCPASQSAFCVVNPVIHGTSASNF